VGRIKKEGSEKREKGRRKKEESVPGYTFSLTPTQNGLSG